MLNRFSVKSLWAMSIGVASLGGGAWYLGSGVAYPNNKTLPAVVRWEPPPSGGLDKNLVKAPAEPGDSTEIAKPAEPSKPHLGGPAVVAPAQLVVQHSKAQPLRSAAPPPAIASESELVDEMRRFLREWPPERKVEEKFNNQNQR